MQDILFKLTQLENRMANVVRHGRVQGYKNGKAQVNFGETDGKPFLTPWLDSSSYQGTVKNKRPLKEGQNVTVISPNGEIGTHSMIVPFTGSKENNLTEEDAPDDAETYWFGEKTKLQIKDGSAVLSMGEKVSVTVTDGKVHVKAGDTEFEWTEGGLRAVTASVDWGKA